MTANGQLAPNQLVNYRGVWLAPQAAADAALMEAAAAKAGFTMRPVGSKNGAAGYRSVPVQEDMHAHPTTYGLLPSPPAPPLAPVGYSRHGQGRALDIADASAGSGWRAWLLKNGPTFHWISWKMSDPNHFEHGVGDVVTVTEAGLAPAGNASSPLARKEIDMIIYQSTTASADGVIPNGTGFLRTDGPLQALSKAEFDAYEFFNANGIPVALAKWSGDDIRRLSKSAGVLQFTMSLDLYPVFTGKVIYDDPTKADYPRVSGPTAPVDTVTKAELDAALATIKFPTKGTVTFP